MSESGIKNEGSGVEASGEESAGEMTWQKPVFNPANPEAKQENPRIARKKRTHYNSISHSGINGLTLASDNPTSQRPLIGNRAPYGKNSRKSRNGYRATPKKNSGKDVWIRVSDELDELELDYADPDYVSEEENPAVVQATDRAVLNDDAFEEYFSNLIREYYDHCKVEEVIDGLKEIAMTPLQRRKLPSLAINMALQYKMDHCELTSELLSEMCGKVMSNAAMQQGFQMLLDDMSDIVLDAPKAPEYVGRFIARAVADDILPPKFVQQYKEVNAAMPPAGSPPAASDSAHPPVRIAGRSDATQTISPRDPAVSPISATIAASGDAHREPVNFALQAINRAENLLTLSHAYRHLDIVWGLPESERVTTMLMKQISCILQNYLRKEDMESAVTALRELDAPHYLHELVYQSVMIVLENNGADEPTTKHVLSLLDNLCRSVVISLDQLMTGVRRVYAELPEMQQDLPVVHVLLDRFLRAAVQLGFVPQKLVNEMPAKPRKRFVSEGDGFRKSAAATSGKRF